MLNLAYLNVMERKIMKKIALFSVYTSVLISLFIFQAPVFAYNVDGNLDDWGVTPESDWQPNEGIFSWVEDYTDYRHNGYVGPGYGGQPFDVEAMYATVNNGNLYVAIVTGMPPVGSGPMYSANDTPHSSPYYYPGDIGFDFNGDGFFEYGLETTGRSDNTLDGYAQNGQYSYNPQLVGDVYSVKNSNGWNKGIALSDYTPTELNYRQIASLEKLYKATIMYIQTANPLKYVIETSIPLDIFNPVYGVDWTIHWTMTCGNDIGDLIVNFNAPSDSDSVPEPFSIFILATGLFGIFVRGKFGSKSNN